MERPYKVPGGKIGIWLGVIIGAILCALLIVPMSPVALDLKEWIILGGWLIFGSILYIISRREKVESR